MKRELCCLRNRLNSREDFYLLLENHSQLMRYRLPENWNLISCKKRLMLIKVILCKCVDI